MKLHLGCGGNILAGYDNYDNGSCNVSTLDSRARPIDLNARWPFPDSYADEILMVHVLEHLQDTYFIMSEVQRVLKPGGLFHGEVPFAFSNAGMNHPQHYRHFTHVSFAHLAEDFKMTLLRAELVSDFARSHDPYKRVRDALLGCLPRKARYFLAYHFNNIYDSVQFELRK